MKILHTSDWHLGQKFLYNDRQEEHELALAWLRQTIITQAVDCLLVAGDIFDVNNPPNHARNLYYRFLTGLLGTCCRHIVIVGGNHDSPSMLHAPRELLRQLNIHVVGAVGEGPAEEIVLLKNPAGETEAVVAAVPFLRDRDLHCSVAGEGGFERVARIREGILQHYLTLGELVAEYRDVPVIATGHLYASGAEASGKQDNIYIGNVENIDAGQFPAVFDYVALGHIHRPQVVGGIDRVRYSGSLIPLSFSETKDDKSVFLVHFSGKSLQEVTAVPAPVFRRLKTIEGDLPKIKKSLERFAEKETRQLTPWVEIIVETQQMIPQLDIQLRDFCKDMNLEILKIKIKQQYAALDASPDEIPDLSELEDELGVFRKRCQSYGSLPENMEQLEGTFRELMAWMSEREAAD